MAHSTMLHVRVDDKIKTQASEALAAMGLNGFLTLCAFCSRAWSMTRLFLADLFEE
mgnify:CR=1 FL=1